MSWIRDQNEINRTFFSPEAIEQRRLAKLSGDIAKIREQTAPAFAELGLKGKEMKFAQAPERFEEAKTLATIRNIPELAKLRWEKSPRRYKQQKGLLEASPEMAQARTMDAWRGYQMSPLFQARQMELQRLQHPYGDMSAARGLLDRGLYGRSVATPGGGGYSYDPYSETDGWLQGRYWD